MSIYQISIHEGRCAIKKQSWGEKPISEATFYILLGLVEPLHGYGVMKKVAELSQGTVSIGPGTLYGTLSKLSEARLIYKASDDGRRKTYGLSSSGKEHLLNLVERLAIMSRVGEQTAEQLSGDAR